METKHKYKLGSLLGQGGMADVFIARQWGDDGFARVCAIKKVQARLSGDKSFVNLFRDEARICQSLHHNNILQIFDLVQIDGCQAMVMEFVDGVDLKSLVRMAQQRATAFPAPVAAFIAAEVARGLHHAHTRTDERSGQPLGIVHRDVTPENILVSFDGEIKLTDFGVATAYSKSEKTEPGTIKGKFAYMSPEQVTSRPLDGRSDVFSSGLVLWECLAMRRFLPDDKPLELIKAIAKFEYKNCILPTKEALDPDLEHILRRALTRNLKERYASAGELERDLRLYLSFKHPAFTVANVTDFVCNVGNERRLAQRQQIMDFLNSATGDRALSQTQSPPVPQLPRAAANNSVPSGRQPASKALPLSVRQLPIAHSGSRSAGRGLARPSSASGHRNGSSPGHGLAPKKSRSLIILTALIVVIALAVPFKPSAAESDHWLARMSDLPTQPHIQTVIQLVREVAYKVEKRLEPIIGKSSHAAKLKPRQIKPNAKRSSSKALPRPYPQTESRN